MTGQNTEAQKKRAAALDPEYYTTREMTVRFRVEAETLRRWRKRRSNPLPAFRFGRDYRYRVVDVAHWEKGLRVLVGGAE